MSQSLYEIAKQLVAPGKGILAADESTNTLKKRMDKIGIEFSEENRRAYRELLLTAPGISSYVSGVILFDETIRQATKDGVPFSKVLENQGIIPGIKVDLGLKPVIEGGVEMLATDGLDSLAKRLTEYYALGARFAKWRAIFTIGGDLPSGEVVLKNADALAEYALICQQNNIVPIVEPEVMMDGSHDIQKCFEVTSCVLSAVFKSLKEKGVDLEEMLLKPNMVLPGAENIQKATPQQIAEMTVKCLMDIVPPTVPGIVFLSGGQSDIEACENLQAMNQLPRQLPWQLSFSFGRALQSSALKTWTGKEEHVDRAKKIFACRAKLVSAARSGNYTPEMENELNSLIA